MQQLLVLHADLFTAWLSETIRVNFRYRPIEVFMKLFIALSVLAISAFLFAPIFPEAPSGFDNKSNGPVAGERPLHLPECRVPQHGNSGARPGLGKDSYLSRISKPSGRRIRRGCPRSDFR